MLISLIIEASRYVRTPILSNKVIEYLESKGVNFATLDDCARAVIYIASRKEANGTLVTQLAIVWEP